MDHLVVKILEKLLLLIVKFIKTLRKNAFCQPKWLDEKLQPREDQHGSLLFDVQSDEDFSFEVFKVPEAKSIALEDLNEVISSL